MRPARLLARAARFSSAGEISVFVVAGVVVVDALAKIVARTFLDTKSVQLASGVVLRVFENFRGPFSLGPLWLTLAASIIVLVLFLRCFPNPKPQALNSKPPALWPLALLIGGGLSNLGERLIFGRTTDLLILWNLTALNFADVAILLGLVLLVVPFPRKATHVS